MPILWRYLLSHYLKVFLLCVTAIVAILLTMRLDEIAYFATLGPQAFHILWFAMQQVPYMIPIALPFSALISSTLLMLNLSQSRELVAMRSCGYALRDILAPVLAASLFLSALNFYIVSEISTTSHLSAGKLKSQLRSINPLLLMHNKQLMQLKGFYFDTLGSSRVGDFAQDVLFFSPNRHHERMNLMVAKLLQASPILFLGEQITFLTGQEVSEKDKGVENLVVENMTRSSTSIQAFSQMWEKKIWMVNNDHLRLPLLLVRLEETKKAYANLKFSDDREACKQARYDLNRCRTEILRRLSVSLAVFSFTFMGLAFGINVGRHRSSFGLLMVVILGALYLVAFFAAKSFDYAFLFSALLYIVPHVIICAASLWMLSRVARGIE